MWRRIGALVVKEMLALLRDRRSRSVIVFPPIVQLIIFGYAATYDITDVSFAVYNQDFGTVSRLVEARFSGSHTFDRVHRINDDEGRARVINQNKALLVLHFGPDFSEKMLQGETASLQVIIDGRNSNTALIVLGYVRSIISGFNRQWAQKQGLPSTPTRLETRAWFNPNTKSRWFIIPGIVGLLTLVVTMLVTALSVAREREAGTFDQLLVTPLRPFEILAERCCRGSSSESSRRA